MVRALPKARGCLSRKKRFDPKVGTAEVKQEMDPKIRSEALCISARSLLLLFAEEQHPKPYGREAHAMLQVGAAL